jgi:hypothetical protein
MVKMGRWQDKMLSGQSLIMEVVIDSKLICLGITEVSMVMMDAQGYGKGNGCSSAQAKQAEDEEFFPGGARNASRVLGATGSGICGNDWGTGIGIIGNEPDTGIAIASHESGAVALHKSWRTNCHRFAAMAVEPLVRCRIVFDTTFKVYRRWFCRRCRRLYKACNRLYNACHRPGI